MMIRAEINEVKTKKTTEKINEAKSWSCEKINKINKPSAKYMKRKGREHISIKLEMKKELQQTSQKHKASLETIIKNYVPTQWTT